MFVLPLKTPAILAARFTYWLRIARYRETISANGAFSVSTWPIGCDTPSPFSERFPLPVLPFLGFLEFLG